MSAKSKSPEAAQKKVWKAELKTHERSRIQIGRDYAAARKPFVKAVEKARNEFIKAGEALEKFDQRVAKQMPREVQAVERRIDIIKGRLGI